MKQVARLCHELQDNMYIAIHTSLLDYIDMYGILKLVFELPAYTHSAFLFRMESQPQALTWFHTGMTALYTLWYAHACTCTYVYT